MERIESIIKSDHPYDAGFLPGLDDAIGIEYARRDRLFEIDMLPLLHGCDRHFCMGPGRYAHDDRVDVPHLQQIAIVRMGQGRRNTSTSFSPPIWIGLRERNEFCLRQPAQDREVNCLCEPAAADDANSKRVLPLRHYSSSMPAAVGCYPVRTYTRRTRLRRGTSRPMRLAASSLRPASAIVAYESPDRQ